MAYCFLANRNDNGNGIVLRAVFRSVERGLTVEQLQVFESLVFGKLRILELDNVIWFVGADVGKALGYTNSRKAIKDHVDAEDISRNEALRVNGKLVTLINALLCYALSVIIQKGL